MGGVALDPPNGPNGSPDGIWTMPGTALNSAAGRSDVSVSWCIHIGHRELPERRPEGSDIPVHSLFRNDDGIAPVLDMVRTSGSPTPGSGRTPAPCPLHCFRAQTGPAP